MPLIRTFLALLGFFCVQASAARPNILFAIADDWGVHAGAYQTRWVKTPAFDRLAREGLLFQNAYTPVAKCAPSRACVLTGRHLWQNDEAGNHLAFFPQKFKSWPEALMENGWHIGITGKGWGPGIAHDANGKPRLITGKSYNQRSTKPATTGMSGNDYAANFIDFLDAAPKDAPWCFWYGALEPHREYEFKSGATQGGKKLTDIDRVPAYWPDHASNHVLIGKERNDVGRPHNGGYPIRGIITADHLDLHNYEPSRWPASNPETGYLDTDGGPIKLRPWPPCVCAWKRCSNRNVTHAWTDAATFSINTNPPRAMDFTKSSCAVNPLKPAG